MESNPPRHTAQADVRRVGLPRDRLRGGDEKEKGKRKENEGEKGKERFCMIVYFVLFYVFIISLLLFMCIIFFFVCLKINKLTLYKILK